MPKRPEQLFVIVVLVACASVLLVPPLRRATRWQLQGAVELALARPFLAPAAVTLPTHIAHAGGSLLGLSYTNSLEALDRNYARDTRWFEMDFARDGKGDWWAVHDWAEVHAAIGVPLDARGLGLPGQDSPGAPYHLARLTQVLDWFAHHPDATLVTDTKDDNPQLLRRLAEAPAALRPRIHPQIYRIPEYPLARSGGLGAPIFTTYRSQYPWWVVSGFAARQPLLAVTVTGTEVPEALRALAGRVPLLTHTVNDAAEADRLARAGLAGIYTDDLLP
jgi:hypothetical protein